MRRALVLAVVFMCVVGSALEARAHGMHGFRHGGYGHRGPALPDSLALTDAQLTQLSALRDSMGQHELTLRQAYQDSLLAVLTAEQRAALDSVRAGCRGGYRSPVPLDLTAAQVERIQSLSAAFVESLQALRDQYQAQVATILTPEQVAMIDVIRGIGMLGGWGRLGPGKGGEDPGDGTQGAGDDTLGTAAQAAATGGNASVAAQALVAAGSGSSASPVEAAGAADPATAATAISWGELKGATSR